MAKDSKKKGRRASSVAVDDREPLDSYETEESSSDAPVARKKGKRQGGKQDLSDEEKEARAEAREALSRPTGWDGLDELKKALPKGEGGDFIDGDVYWKPTSGEDEVLVKFLDDDPFLVYYDVWVQSQNRGYATTNPNNPLVGVLGLKAAPKALFNILLLGYNSKGEPVWEPRVFRATTKPTEVLKAQATGRRGPLSKHYWEVTASGQKGSYSFNMNALKEEDVEEDWEVEPLDAKALKKFKKKGWDKKNQFLYTDEELDRIAAEIAG